MIKVAIVGGTGYTGIELLRLLAQHPEVKLQYLSARSESKMSVFQLFPSLRTYLPDIVFEDFDKNKLLSCDVVFFATPHGVAMHEAKFLLQNKVKVIDLGADFRLKDLKLFQSYYGIKHACPELLDQAVYGLVEINRKQITSANLIAVPGCYPTAVQLGLAPLLNPTLKNLNLNCLIDHTNLIADVKSGVSGAGKKATATLFAQTSDNFKAYGVEKHRHHPEIVQGCNLMLAQSSSNVGLTFIPHLTPMIRGIYATIYAPILPAYLEQNFQTLFENFYLDEIFVDVMPYGSLPETGFVRGSNNVKIAVHRSTNSNSNILIILVTIDNLVKGAAGQAVQCMNLMFNLLESCGLMQIPISL